MKPLISQQCRVVWLLVTAVWLYACGEKKPPPVQGTITDATELVTSGKVVEYGSNKSGDVDEMVLLSNGETIHLHFPPHTAGSVMAIAKPSATVNITAEQRKQSPNSAASFKLIAVAVGDATLNVHDIPPPPPQRGSDTTVSGRAINIRTGETGKVHAFEIGRTLVTLPPHVAMNLAAPLAAAKSIIVKGNRRVAGNGFVNSRGLDVMRPYTILIDSVTYTIE